MKTRKFIPGAVFAAAALIAGAAHAHHGTGLFVVDEDVEYSGTLTDMELVNPHSYMHFEIAGPDGQPFAMRCEMRAAMLIRRSGWELEMFVPGSRVTIKGHPLNPLILPIVRCASHPASRIFRVTGLSNRLSSQRHQAVAAGT